MHVYGLDQSIIQSINQLIGIVYIYIRIAGRNNNHKIAASLWSLYLPSFRPISWNWHLVKNWWWPKPKINTVYTFISTLMTSSDVLISHIGFAYTINNNIVHLYRLIFYYKSVSRSLWIQQMILYVSNNWNEYTYTT